MAQHRADKSGINADIQQKVSSRHKTIIIFMLTFKNKCILFLFLISLKNFTMKNLNLSVEYGWKMSLVSLFQKLIHKLWKKLSENSKEKVSM